MHKAILLFITISLLSVSGLAQTKSRVAAPAPAYSFQEADYLFTFGENAGRDKQSLAVVERALAAEEVTQLFNNGDGLSFAEL